MHVTSFLPRWSLGVLWLCLLPGMALRADVLDNSLIARYNADSAEQLLLDTAPGHAVSHDGINDNVSWVASDAGRSGLLKFTAQSAKSQFTVAPHADFDSTVGTITFWMNSAGNVGAGNDGALILDRRGGAGDVIVLSNTGELLVQATSAPGSVANSFATIATVADGEWHHVAYVYDQSLEGYTKIFVDGELDTDQPTLNEWFWEPDRQLEFGVSHDPWWRRYDGRLDDVRFYNVDLSDNVAQIMQEQTPQVATSNLVARYDFANGGNPLADSGPAGTAAHDGTNDGVVWESSYQQRTGVMKFMAGASLGSQFTVDPHADFDEPTGTICFWVKTSGNTGPGNDASIVFDRRTGIGDVIAMMNDGTLVVQATSAPGSVANSFVTSGTINDDQWHHVAYVYDQGVDEMTQIYIDGELDSEQAAVADWFWDPDRQLEFGRSSDPYWRRFDGLMDDVRIYNRRLTAAEILEVASASLTLPGDFDANGVLDVTDIDQLTAAAAAGDDPKYDLTQDGLVNVVDVDLWVKQLKKTWIGDADVDGEFTSSDFVQVFAAGKYEMPTAAVWSEGDWNGSGKFDSSDFVAAFADGGYEVGPRPVGAVSAVPEPTARYCGC